MLKDYGIDRFLAALRGLGLTTATRSAEDYGLTLVLGGAEGTLWDLAGMYAGLAREALRYAEPRPDNAVRRTFFPPHVAAARPDLGGAPPDVGEAPATGPASGLLGPASSWLALEAMAEVSRPDAEKYWRNFASSRWVAWKTGTSFGFRDAWAVGVTPEFTVGVWVGNASGEGRPGMTGIQVAAPLLFDAFNLLPPTTRFPRPMASLRRAEVCARSGMRPGPDCPRGTPGDSAWIPEAGLRTAPCPYHRIAHLDPSGHWQVHDGCQAVASMRHEPWFVLPPAEEWFYRRRHGDYLPLPPWRADCEEAARAFAARKSMDLLYPRAASSLYVPVNLGARRGRTVFEAIHRDPGATVYWHLDADFLGETREFHKLAADPAPGRHVLLLVDDKGERLEQAFEVLARDADPDG
jgi:penicillin-binding protein 1C